MLIRIGSKVIDPAAIRAIDLAFHDGYAVNGPGKVAIAFDDGQAMTFGGEDARALREAFADPAVCKAAGFGHLAILTR